MKTGFAFLLAAPVMLAGITACSDAPQQITESGIPAPVITAFALVSSPAIETLGELAFQDKNLSLHRNQSCQTCHEPSEGFAASLASVPTRGSVVQGSKTGAFGDRKPPSAAYAPMAPNYSAGGNGGTGGNFWDGRATGALLGNPAADQARGPFLNPVEQALPDEACVVMRVLAAYPAQYSAAWGAPGTINYGNAATACEPPGSAVTMAATDRARVATVYNNIARSIAAYEAGSKVSRFSSRFDRGQLTEQEKQGAKLFSGKGKCHQCHPSNGSPVLFSDFNFHNIGAPKNPANPIYTPATALSDRGLGGVTGRAAHDGKFRTPTVRNTALGSNRTYLHNGVLQSVKQVVDFYNTRDLLPVCTDAQLVNRVPAEYGSYDPDGAGPLSALKCWPKPETNVNLDTKQMGNLGLTEAQVDAIVAFIRALND